MHPQFIPIKHILFHRRNKVMHFFEMAPLVCVGEEGKLGVVEFDVKALLVRVGVAEGKLEEGSGTVGRVYCVGGCSVQSQFSCDYLIDRLDLQKQNKILIIRTSRFERSRYNCIVRKSACLSCNVPARAAGLYCNY
jgi:hypothetical protein